MTSLSEPTTAKVTTNQPILRRGRYQARFAATAADVQASQALRHLCFFHAAGRPAQSAQLDADGFDTLCRHVLIEDCDSGDLLCSFRLLPLANGTQIHTSYSAQYYGLDRLHDFAGPMVEMGRFCVHPAVQDPDVLRVAWGAMTVYVDAHKVELLFGCSSFAGTDADAYRASFDLLAANHIAPSRWQPVVKAPNVVRYAQSASATPDRRSGLLQMPALLKTYLGMGGWVSDHAVIDDAMNTLHVFTGVEIAAIPPARARALRAVAQG